MKRTEKPGNVPSRQTISFLHKEISTHSQITNLFKKHFLLLPHTIKWKSFQNIQKYKKITSCVIYSDLQNILNGLNCIYVERRLYEIFVSKYLNVETRKTIGALLYSNAGKSSVQSSELNAKSDTNEIKLMVTDHADGNRFLHYTSLCHCDKPTAGLNSGETSIVLFYPGY